MQKLWLDSTEPYNGEQLHSLWAYLNHKVLGDSIVSWVGSCDVSFEHMVDGEDLLAKSEIASDKMVHFIVEVFERELFSAVVLQRLLATHVADYVYKKSGTVLARKGDDLFLDEGKFNISIAAPSPSSKLIHFAVNVSNSGTPVNTSCLEDLNLEPFEFSQEVMSSFSLEYLDIIRATQKVKWVK